MPESKPTDAGSSKQPEGAHKPGGHRVRPHGPKGELVPGVGRGLQGLSTCCCPARVSTGLRHSEPGILPRTQQDVPKVNKRNSQMDHPRQAALLPHVLPGQTPLSLLQGALGGWWQGSEMRAGPGGKETVSGGNQERGRQAPGIQQALNNGPYRWHSGERMACSWTQVFLSQSPACWGGGSSGRPYGVGFLLLL